MSIVCFILGHQSEHVPLGKPNDFPVASRLVGCQRCNLIYGVWVWFLGSWNYFKR